MNAQIVKLFGFFVVLFALLIVFTTRWTVIDATALNNNKLNHRTIDIELKIKRGRILAANGEPLARSVPKKGGGWSRRDRCSPKRSATGPARPATPPGSRSRATRRWRACTAS